MFYSRRDFFEIEGVRRDTCLQGKDASEALFVAGKKIMCIMFIPFQYSQKKFCVSGFLARDKVSCWSLELYYRNSDFGEIFWDDSIVFLVIVDNKL